MNIIKTSGAGVRGTFAHDSDPLPITIGAQAQTEALIIHNLDFPLLQIGFDRTCASGRAGRLRLFPVQPPECILLSGTAGQLVLVRVRDRRPTPRFPWTRTATYVHQPTGHHVQLFYDRAVLSAPHLYANLWPAAGLLFSPATLLLLLNALSQALELPLRFSKLEIAADFAARPIDAPRLASQLWVPRIPDHRCIGDAASATTYRGAPSSAFALRTYWKLEGALQAVRVEFIFCRRVLRNLHVDAPEDLARAAWATVCSKKARVVTVPTDLRRRTTLSLAAREAFASGGIFAVQDLLGKPGMRWLSRNIVSSPMQHTLEAALSTLGQLPAGAPEEMGPAEFVDPATVTALLRSVTDASMDVATLFSPGGTIPTLSDDLMENPTDHADALMSGGSD